MLDGYVIKLMNDFLHLADE